MPNADFEQPMDFGFGVDSLQLKVRGVGVTFSAPTEVVAQTVEFAIHNIQTYEDFQSAFHFEADASATYGLFHGSAKFTYAENRKFKRFSRYLVASVVVTNGFRHLPADTQLTTPARALLVIGHTARFQEEFGDTFIQSIKTGGVYYAVLEFTCESEQDLREISAQLDGGEWGVFTGSAAFSTKLQNFKGHTNLRVSAFQQGGAHISQPINVDDIIAKAINFPPDVQQVPFPYSAFLQDYKSLDLPNGPNLIDVENARQVLRDYLSLRNQLLQKLNEIEYIQQFPDQFINPDINGLAQMHSQVAQLLNQVTRGASDCANNIMQCQFTGISIPNFPLPTMRPGIQPVQPVQMVQVPDVSNLSVAQAQAKLSQLGLGGLPQPEDVSFQWYHFNTIHTLHGPDRTVAIIGTIPESGTMVQLDSTVIIRVPGHVIEHPDIVIHTS